MKIYVVGSHKNKFLPLNEIREPFYIDDEHDGDNIDHLNKWLCEMTGLYHLWKNTSDDIVGLEHYRRYFVKDDKILSATDVKDKLKHGDIICAKAQYSKTRPPKTWLIMMNKYNDMLKFLAFAKVYVGQDYYDHCINHLNGTYHCLGNMFICDKKLIDEYCEFIFDVTIKYKEAETYYGRALPDRILGYFTEFLFGAWLNWKSKKIVWNDVRIIK